MAVSTTITCTDVADVWTLDSGVDYEAHRIIISRFYGGDGRTFLIGDGDVQLWVDIFAVLGFTLTFTGGVTAP